MEVPRLPRPVLPSGPSSCLLAHFLPGLRLQRLPGGERGTDPGALRADDKVKESLRPPGTPYLSRVFNPPVPPCYHPLILSFQGSGWLITVIPLHNQRDCVVLFAPLILSLHGGFKYNSFFLTSGPVGQQLKIAAFPSFCSSPTDLLLPAGPVGAQPPPPAPSPPPPNPPAVPLHSAILKPLNNDCHTSMGVSRDDVAVF